MGDALKFYTAVCLRQKTEEALEGRLGELTALLDSAARQGKYEATVRKDLLDSAVIRRLKELGYRVAKNMPSNESTPYVIGW